MKIPSIVQFALKNGMLIFSLVLFSSEYIQAQSPVFTDTAFAPQAGDQYTVNNAQYISPGLAGANQTWDFSAAFLTSISTYSVTGVGAIPCGNQYPTATLGIGINGYEMIQRTWNEYNVVGTTITPGQANFIYNDPEKRFKFPMNFNTTYTDLYAGVSTVAQPTYRDGFVLVSCDGFGTVITPTATYTNALRFHRTDMHTDSSATGGDTCTGEYYYWFAPGNRYPVAQIWSVTCTGGTSMGAMFLDSITIGVSENEGELTVLNVFPNPVSNSLTITSTETQVGQSLFITDVSGRIVKSLIISSTETRVDISDVNSGVYYLRSEDGRTVKIAKVD